MMIIAFSNQLINGLADNRAEHFKRMRISNGGEA